MMMCVCLRQLYVNVIEGEEIPQLGQGATNVSRWIVLIIWVIEVLYIFMSFFCFIEIFQ